MLSVVRPSVTYFATPTVVMMSVFAPQRCDRRELPGEEKGKKRMAGKDGDVGKRGRYRLIKREEVREG